MDRRDFFRLGAKNVAEATTRVIEKKIENRALRWIRPPFAQPELDFLLACTRCNACIEACPHQTLFPLSARLGAQVVATPAMDLLNKSCHLCDDWPCVEACDDNALGFPIEDSEPPEKENNNPEHSTANLPPELLVSGTEQENKLDKPVDVPTLSIASINPSKCLPYQGPECGACRDACSIDGALRWEGPKPYIDTELCVGCAQCREACIVEPKAIEISPYTSATTDNEN